jgi:hypothetical protein
LAPPLTLKQWETETPFKFGEALRERRGRHTQRGRRFGEGLVICGSNEIGQLLHGQVEKWPLTE